MAHARNIFKHFILIGFDEKRTAFFQPESWLEMVGEVNKKKRFYTYSNDFGGVFCANGLRIDTALFT
jgi:hypothetical protein